MKKPSALFVLALLLAGCRYELPVADSGFVETHSHTLGLDKAAKTELSANQLKALADWFSRHPSGWQYKVADVAPGALVYLKHGDKNVAGVNLRPEGIYVANYFRVLTPEERTQLQVILGVNES